MAEGLGQAREDLEGELTCPLCLGIYEDPKILPCGHIYCKSPCLVGLARQGNNTAITCPECRGVTPVQNGNVGAFPTAFHINRLKDLHRTMQESGGASASIPKTCQTHKSQELAIFCETCKKILCRDCVLDTDYHKEHQYDFIQKVAKKYRKDLLEMLEPRKTQHQSLSQALVRCDETKSDISRKEVLLSRDLDSAIECAVQKLTERRQDLHSKLSSSTTHKLSKVCAQEQQLTRAHLEFSRSISAVENVTENLTDIDLVYKMTDLKAQLEQATTKAKKISLSPPTFTDEHLYTATPDSLIVVTNQFHLGTLTDPSKCTFGIEGIESAQVGQEVSMFVDVDECVGDQNVVMEMFYVRNLSLTSISATRLDSGRYQVKFTPRDRGRYMIGVKVNGKHLVGSPMKMFVRVPPQKLDAPVAVIPGLKRPSSLTCSGDMVLVCECKRNQIIGIDRNFQKVCVIGKDLKMPAELTTDSDSNIYVTTFCDHRLHKLDKNGRHLKVIGSHGSGARQFDYPNGVHISKSDKLYVCDTNNHRIKVFDLELNLLQTFGKKGSKLGQFLQPANVRVDSDRMYVTELDNCRIQVLTLAEKPIATLGCKLQLFYRPVSIHIVDGLAFVTDCVRNCVQVITTSDEYVTTFGDRYLSQPEGITIDQDGFVYVTSHMNQIIVF